MDYKTADWGKVIEICERELRSKSKDLQLAVWYVEALAKERSLRGISQGLVLVKGLLERYWHGLYPQLEDGKDEQNIEALEMRSGRLDQLDRALSKCVQNVQVTAGVGEQVRSMWEWKHLRIMYNAAGEPATRLSPKEEKEQLSREADELSAKLSKAVVDTPSEFYADLQQTIQCCRDQSEELRATVDEKFRSESFFEHIEAPLPTFLELRDALEECDSLLRTFMRQKPSAPTKTPQGKEPPGLCDGRQLPLAGGNPNGPIGDRAQALCLLSAIAGFFEKTEPYTPVSLLLRRALRWADMDLVMWLKEMINEPAVLERMRENLGITKAE